MARPTREHRRKMQRNVHAVRRRVRMAGAAKRPVGYRGISQGEFHRILDKASRPIKKRESGQEQS